MALGWSKITSSFSFDAICQPSAGWASRIYTSRKAARSLYRAKNFSRSPDRRRKGGQVKLPKTSTRGRPAWWRRSSISSLPSGVGSVKFGAD